MARRVHAVVDAMSRRGLREPHEKRDRNLVEYQLATATAQEAVARHAALHDVLTGLPNRALSEGRLEHGLAQVKRIGCALVVMFIDLEGYPGTWQYRSARSRYSAIGRSEHRNFHLSRTWYGGE